MRLALMAQSCDNETGIGRIVLSLATEFVGLGHGVHLVAQSFKERDSRWNAHQIPLYSKYNSLNRLVLRVAAPQVLRSLQCDIVNSFIIGRGASVQTAQSCHKAGMEIRKQHTKGNIWRKNLGLFDRMALQDERVLLCSSRTKRIIAVSALVKNQIIDYYDVESDRITIVPNGVDVNYFASLRQTIDRTALRHHYNIQDDECLLLFVGNEFDRKGLQCIIRSLAQLRRRDLKLLVIGGDDPAPYQELAHTLGVERQIVFAGIVRGPEKCFVSADLLVFPTLYEPFGLVVLEAMAAGVPVIASRTTGAVEGLLDTKNGLYLDDPTSADELSNAIQRMVDDTRLRKNIVRENDLVIQEFSWSNIAAKTLDVYNQVC